MTSGGIDPGCVRLRLACRDGQVSSVGVTSERPAIASHLRGRPAGDVARLVPLLYSLCGRAQGRAAALALAAARGSEQAAHLDEDVQREVLREHLLRWLLDLPVLLGESALRQEFLAATAAVTSGRRAEIGTLLSGSAIDVLCRRLMAAADVVGDAPRFLPPLNARASLDCWPALDPAFALAPCWQGAAAETGAIARRANSCRTRSGAFAARWLARLDELRDWANGSEEVGAGGTASSAPVGAGRGRALVETARGVLMHEITLDGERIVDYVIVAPTEWNFHPDGTLVRWLTGRDASDRGSLEHFAARAVAALDPCVRWELQFPEI